MLADLLDDGEIGETLPEVVRPMFAMLAELDKRIAVLDKGDCASCSLGRGSAPVDDHSRHWSDYRHGHCGNSPPAETFVEGRDFVAWLGLVPKQMSTGRKQKLGAISRMGERTLRRLLSVGSTAAVLQASKRGAPAGSWLESMLERKPRMLVTIALANKMARTARALLIKQEDYRAPVAVVA